MLDEAKMREAFATTSYPKFMGITLVDYGPRWVKLQMPIRGEEFRQAAGVVHGGVIYSLADSALGAALLTDVEPEESVNIAQVTINFVDPVFACELFCEARIIRRGRRIAHGVAEVTDDAGKLVATCSAIILPVRPRGDKAGDLKGGE